MQNSSLTSTLYHPDTQQPLRTDVWNFGSMTAPARGRVRSGRARGPAALGAGVAGGIANETGTPKRRRGRRRQRKPAATPQT